MKSRIAFIGLVALVPGCCGMCGMCSDSTRSSNVRTSGVRAEMIVHSGEAGPTEVSARVRVGGTFSNTFLTLADGDELVADNGTDHVALVGSKGLIAVPSNDGTLPTDSSGRTITVKFMRPHDTSAPATTVVMPHALGFGSPRVGESFDSAPILALVEKESRLLSLHHIRFEAEATFQKLHDRVAGRVIRLRPCLLTIRDGEALPGEILHVAAEPENDSLRFQFIPQKIADLGQARQPGGAVKF